MSTSRSCVVHSALLVLALLLAGGCTRSKVFTTARFEPGAEKSITRAAPKGAVYKVKWFNPRDGELHTVHGTERAVLKGERLGFGTAPDGRVLAVVGDEQIALDALNRHASYCVWSTKVKKPTRLARGVHKAGQVLATGGRIAARGRTHCGGRLPQRVKRR